MKSLIIKIFLLNVLFPIATVKGQDLSEHRWKQRVLIILTNDVKDRTYQNQIDSLKTHIADLNERKIFIYRVIGERVKTGLQSQKRTSSNEEIRSTIKASQFEVMLYGLDGGIKMRQSKPISIQDLNALIDGMPIRRSELRKKKIERG